MSETTELMIKSYYIRELGYDFMGYSCLNSNDILTFHHLIVPACVKSEKNPENGAILYRTSHDYIHLIENYDLDIFDAITSEMIDMVIKKYLDMKNIVEIHKLLCLFESKYCNIYKHGQLIIKEQYTRRLIKR